MRKTRKFRGINITTIPFSKGNTQYACGFNGIFTKGFVKVTHPKKQNRIRVSSLDGIMLFH